MGFTIDGLPSFPSPLLCSLVSIPSSLVATQPLRKMIIGKSLPVSLSSQLNCYGAGDDFLSGTSATKELIQLNWMELGWTFKHNKVSLSLSISLLELLLTS